MMNTIAIRLIPALALLAGPACYADAEHPPGKGLWKEVSGTAIEMGAVTTLRVVKIHKGMGEKLPMPATKGNEQIINMEPTRYYQTVGIPLKGAGESPPTHKYLTGTKIDNGDACDIRCQGLHQIPTRLFDMLDDRFCQ